jgi:hypothetical protein
LGHSGGEQRRLALCRSGFENQIDFLGESHVEHLVCFVQHNRLEVGQDERPAAQMVECSSGRGYDDMRPPSQSPDLLVERGPAVDREHTGSQGPPVTVEGFRHLHGQLAGGHEHENGRTRWLGRLGAVELEQRESKGRGLASAGRGLAQQVSST